MSEHVQFRIQLAASLRDRFKSYCLKSNVTMTDKLEQMIEREVSGMSLTQLRATEKIASLNDDRLIARVIGAVDRLGESAASMGGAWEQSFDAFKTELLCAIPKPPSAAQRAEDARLAAEADQARLQQMLGKTDALSKQIIDAVKLGQEDMRAALQSKRRLRQALGAGVMLGVIAGAILLWTMSGSSPARSLAIRLTGQHGQWNAALWIAGDRKPKSIVLLSETAVLRKRCLRAAAMLLD